ncbi:hypothetical protein NC796_08740 [Aliifodinibius sp. S!AR15-10]|uniref:hypothetical protein n=1 Tax=Aliifodinibius sp. S!AR15-10 TaxID=2950437 RepID=UPI00285B6804|nr:hypothetical protein [Aliifodinibius sp. S!AR15-10]MDR8391222.1 hypothetical protein [Aliifodinibius sp. S!AR15-10]
MTKTSGVEDIQKALEEKSKSDFIQIIEKKRTSRLESFEEVLKELLDNIQDSEPTPAWLLSELQNAIGKLNNKLDQQEQDKLADAYMVAVYQFAGSFDREATIEQNEDRFRPLPKDSIVVKTGKAFKRLFRSIDRSGHNLLNFIRRKSKKPEKTYQPWTQHIPLKQVIEYHLFARTQLPKWWINEDERPLVTIISGLEEFLAEEYSGKSEDNLSELYKSLKKQVEEFLEQIQSQKAALHEELGEDRRAVKKLLLNHFEKAGTFEKRASFYSKARINRTKSKAAQTLSDHAEKWKKVQQSLLDKTGTINRFLDFRNRLEEDSRSFFESIEDYFKRFFFVRISKVQEELHVVQDKLDELDSSRSKKEKLEYLKTSRVQLEEKLDKLINSVEKSLEQRELSQMAEQFSEKALLQANEVADSVPFVHDQKLDQDPPSLSYKTIEWRLLVIRALKEHVLGKVNPGFQKYDEFLRSQINELQEIREVIEVNMGSSQELLEEKGKETEDPIGIAREALERSELKLAQCSESIAKKQDELRNVVLEESSAFYSRLLNLLHTGDPSDFQILDARYRVKETAQSWTTKLRARWARMEDRITLLGRFLLRKWKKYFHSVTTFLGFEEEKKKEEQKAEIAHYLTETDSKVGELPYIYRRLFNFSADTDRRFYVTMNENFNMLSRAYENWQSGFPATFAVMGEKGSGKSTYLNFALDEVFPKAKTTRIVLGETYSTKEEVVKLLGEALGMNKSNSVDAIIASLKRRKKQIIVVEALQNLYLRNLNGYGGLETLLYIISETKDNIFWITSCSSYAWHFLQKTLSVADYFSHILKSDNLTDEQIKSVIMKRHEASGYELVFEPGESQNKDRAYRKLLDKEEEAQEYLRDSYFEKLAALAQGNASIAMIFWVRSIRAYSDTHFYIKPLEVTELELVEELTPEILFPLSAMVLHDSLTPSQLSKILQLNEQESRLILTRLKTRGLLQQNDSQYTLNHLMYRQVVKVLKERNIIHLY